MKRASIWRVPASALLIAASGIAARGSGAPLPAAAQLDLEPGIVAAEAVRATPIILPTTSEVIAAVADAAKVVRYPTQPATISIDRQGCDGSFAATTTPVCVYGDPQGSHTLVVYGDSHGRMWLPAFDAIGKFAHWKVLQLTKGHCQVADYSTWLDSEKRVYGECVAFRSFALDRIRRLHPDVVVLASMWKDALMAVNGRPTTKGLAAAWAAGLASMITKIKQSAKKVIVLGDIAYPKQAGADCLSLHRDDIRPCNTPRVDAVFEADNSIDRTVATRQGALYVNTIPWFCTATVCPAVVGGLATHLDYYHVAPDYALWLADALATATELLPGGSA